MNKLEDAQIYLIAGLTILKKGIIDYTKSFNDVAGKTAVDAFMDQAVGRGHRIVHGHDLSYLPEIYSKFGLEGIGDFFAHSIRDVMSPDGLPLPFANEIKSTLGLSTKQSIDWLCLNIADVLTGAISVAHSVYVFNELRAGNIEASKVFMGSMLKFFTATYSPNPIVLASGVFDLGALFYFKSDEIIENMTKLFSDDVTTEEACKRIGESALYGLGLSFFIRLAGEGKSLATGKMTFTQFLHKHGVHTATDGLSVLISESANQTLRYYNLGSNETRKALRSLTFGFSKVGLKTHAQKLQIKMNWLSHHKGNSDFLFDGDLVPGT